MDSGTVKRVYPDSVKPVHAAYQPIPKPQILFFRYNNQIRSSHPSDRDKLSKIHGSAGLFMGRWSYTQDIA